jgi:O-antigen/teichoic acid export membrane protein
MIGAIHTPESAGIYAASSQLAELVIFAMIAVEMIAAPLISELYSSGNHEQLQRIVTLATRLASLFSIIVAFLLGLFGDTVLSIYGEQFTLGYTALLVLITGQIINALSGSSGLILIMTDHQKSAARIAGASALANVLMNLALIPRFGITGAAIATSASIVLWNLWMHYDVKRRLGINPGIFKIMR